MSPRVTRWSACLIAPLTRAYWLRGGFMYSYAAARIAFAFIYLHVAYGRRSFNVESYLATRNPDAYQPLGLSMLFGDAPPPLAVFEFCHGLLLVCPLLLLVGLFSRLSLLGCILGMYAAAVMDYGWEIEWSHGYSPILVCSLPMLLGPAHLYGIDGWIRRWRGRLWSLSDDRRASMAVLGAQCSIALVFVNAAYWKLYAAGEYANGFVPWVFSDNLRNVFLRQHVALDQSLSPVFRFVVSHPFAYVGLALGNVVAQTVPFLAVWLVSRPWLRLICGLMLALEVIGLGVVMGLANWHWLFFLALFVDWEQFVFGRPLANDADQPPPFTARERIPLVAVISILAFQADVSFTHEYAQRWTFPFTSYPMFSQVAAERPYQSHLPFFLPVARYEFESDHPDPARFHPRIWAPYWGMTWVEDFRPYGGQTLRMALADPQFGSLREVRCYAAMLEFPPCPAVEPKQTLKLLKYRWREGKEQTIVCLRKLDQERKEHYLEADPIGFRDPTFEFHWFDRDGKGPFPLEGERQGSRFYFTHPGRPFVVALEVRDGNQPAEHFAGLLVR
ncbi:MAG: hypothetical protein K2X38_15370 [Gemmataceae bacterium]|nr:hypothetical protein [Gemmataceae bacterium]